MPCDRERNPMIAYRCYFLGENGKIKCADDFEAPNDDEALRAAEQRLAGTKFHQIEVWERARRVGVARWPQDDVIRMRRGTTESDEALAPA